MKYDIVIIGSGPAGQKAAIAASKLGKRVAIIERNFRGMGGVCLHKGTIPSKTMREAILYLTGYRHRDVYSKWYRRKRRITMQDLRLKLADVAEHELEIIHDQLERNGVEVYIGEAKFVSPHEVEVDCETGRKQLYGDYILVATGTKPSRPPHIPFDGETIFDSDEIIDLKEK
ncbi:MAG TPA: Si-specific NAD(P)(+) transhydrogenase, partial [Planctomycetaceae bacterium]|nr:Si-specific NAD(P)(+) transhydrogenase [Planctomycetaceae bacterium]